MGKLRQTAAATLLVVLPIGMAHAVVMDFEALEHVDASTTTTSSPYQEDGFQIAGSALSTFGTLASRFTGSTALFTNVVNGPTTLTKIGGNAET